MATGRWGNLGELDGGGCGDDGVAEQLGDEREEAALVGDLGVAQRREDAPEVHAQDLQLHRHHGRSPPVEVAQVCRGVDGGDDDELRRSPHATRTGADFLASWAALLMGRRKESVDIHTVGLEDSKAVSVLGCKLGRNSVGYLSVHSYKKIRYFSVSEISAIEDW